MMSPRVEGGIAIEHVGASDPRAQYGSHASPYTAIRTPLAERHTDDRDDARIHDAAKRDGQTSQRSSYEGHPGGGNVISRGSSGGPAHVRSMDRRCPDGAAVIRSRVRQDGSQRDGATVRDPPR
jgi:hypothetical protein